MPGPWGEAPFVAISAAFALGIMIASGGWPLCFAALACADGALLAAAALTLARNRSSLAMWLGLSAISLGGVLTTAAQRDGYGADDVRALLRTGKAPLNQPLPFDGCVAEERAHDATDVVVRIELHALRYGTEWQPRQGSILLRVPVSQTDGKKGGAEFLQYGDRIRGWAQFNTRRNFQNPGAAERYEALARRGIYLVGRVKSALLLEVLRGDCASWWQRAPVAVRRLVDNRIASLEHRNRRREGSILASTLLGDYSGLDAETRDVFQNSGTFHVLVVSGLHVAWIAWAMLALLRVLRCPETASRVAVTATILFYTSMVGFQASISRSFWMFAAYLGGSVLFRRGAPVNIAAGSAGLLLSANPDWLFDAGFQLSFLSVAGICLLGAPICERLLRPLLQPARAVRLRAGRLEKTTPARLGRRLAVWCQLTAEACGDRHGAWAESAVWLSLRLAAAVVLSIAAMFVVSAAVQIWIEPVLAFHFNRLSWVAPLASLVVVPLSSAVLAAGIAAAFAAGVPLLAEPSLNLACWLASQLFSAARYASTFDWGWQRCPTMHPAVVIVTTLILLTWTFLCWRRQWLPCVLAGALICSLATARAPSWLHPPGSRPKQTRPWHGKLLRVTFLDVGQGDSAVIRYPDGRIWVLDAGGMREIPNALTQFDIGEVVVSRYLWNSWYTALDRVLITHAHDDHAGGVPAVLRNFGVRELECAGPDPALARTLTTALRRSVPVHLARAGEKRDVAGVEVETLWPPRASGFPSPNESSVVLHMKYGRFSALLTGDMERSTEAQIIEVKQPIGSDLLKVAHHGSRYGTSNLMLDRVQPRWAVVSAGRNNPFGNPSRELLMRLLRHGARPLLTMDLGAISFTTDGAAYAIESYVTGMVETGVLEH